ncbi:MAG: class E sortase [Acidimicrobiia bacterium]
MAGDAKDFGDDLVPPDDYDPFGVSKPIPRFEHVGPVEPLLDPKVPETAFVENVGPTLPFWDRPRQPRDWYWFLGRLGSSLIILGVLMFLFVGYQLWGTGIEEAQSQNRLESAFTELSAAAADAATTVAPTSTVAADIPSTVASTVPITVAPREPIVVDEGDPIALIEMPTIGVEKFVVAGVQTADLKKGPGHYPNTPLPGELGNAAIAGHRTTYGEPFRHLDDLRIGDEIRLTDLFGRAFVYRVTGSQVVDPSDSWVVATTDPTRATLTLTTCNPEFSAKQRLIVSAELDTTVSQPATEPATRYVGEPESSDTGVVDTTTTPAVVPTVPDTIDDVAVDTFEKGWFSDGRAWPHVFGWGALELLIVWGAWQVAKRYRNRIIGAVVGFVPFFFVLYFVFQSVNRLLPPNL